MLSHCCCNFFLAVFLRIEDWIGLKFATEAEKTRFPEVSLLLFFLATSTPQNFQILGLRNQKFQISPISGHLLTNHSLFFMCSFDNNFPGYPLNYTTMETTKVAESTPLMVPYLDAHLVSILLDFLREVRNCDETTTRLSIFYLINPFITIILDQCV